ncbi:MAG: hypothetical protein IJQ17_05640 [Oscillospiraceae bacterium]|nr:hypothetical protein [Oscillospiraceae bacterium]
MKRMISLLCCALLTAALTVPAMADSPKTGDNGIGMWIALLVVVLIVLVGVVVLLLKKSKGDK